MAEAKSPVNKSRQKQIDHDNLVLVKKILALEDASPRQSAKAGAKAHSPVDRGRSQTHRCTHQLPDAPSAACHPLYTRRSSSMRVNFADQNAPTTAHHSREGARHRTHAKILSENRKIAQRIASAPASVSRAAWKDHEQEHLKLRQAISKSANSASKLSQTMSRNSKHSRSCRGLGPVAEVGSMMVITDAPKKRPKSATPLRSCSWAIENRRHSVEQLPRSNSTDSDSMAAQLERLTIELDR